MYALEVNINMITPWEGYKMVWSRLKHPTFKTKGEAQGFIDKYYPSPFYDKFKKDNIRIVKE